MNMSTRGAWGFRIGGIDKITYNHSDSYPEWLGNKIVEFIKTTKVEKQREIAEGIQMVDESKKATLAERRLIGDKFPDVVNLDESSREKTDWHCLIREAQGNFDLYKKGFPFMIENRNFLKDSAFCEWAYIINMDTGKLEFYKGFNEDAGAPGRYSSFKVDENENTYGVRLVAEYPLDSFKGSKVETFVKRMLKDAKGV